MSAKSLLANPALFSQTQPYTAALRPIHLLREYLHLVLKYPAEICSVKAHTFDILGPWLAEFTELREMLNRKDRRQVSTVDFVNMVLRVCDDLEPLVVATGRD